MRILVIYGGYSTERDSSIKTGASVIKALKKKGHEVISIDYSGDAEPVLSILTGDEKPDVVYNALHGDIGENGTIQGFFDIFKIPYVGMRVLGSSLSINKYLSKLVLRGAGISVPKGMLLSVRDLNEAERVLEASDISYPLIIKPNNQGSKLGISYVANNEELNCALKNAFRYDAEVLVEEFVKGKELAISMLDCLYKNKALLPIVEVGHNDCSSDYMKNEKSTHIIPANITQEEYSIVEKTAWRIFDIFKCRHFGRIDMIIDQNGGAVVLEVSALPGMSETSIFPKAALSAGISYEQLIEGLVIAAVEEC